MAVHGQEQVVLGKVGRAQGTRAVRGQVVPATRGDLRAFYRDYTTVASSTGIRIAPDADRLCLVAQLTAVLSSYWWGARF